MTTNTDVLQGTLSRRIARGTATAGDLALLWQLLRCERRRCLVMGAVGGGMLASLALLFAVMVT